MAKSPTPNHSVPATPGAAASPAAASPAAASPAAASPAGVGVSRAGDVFQLLRDGHARIRAELADITGLARSTVAARIDALAAAGLIGPAGEAVSSGGRPPSRFAFQPATRVALTVDVGATHVLIGLTDLSGMLPSELAGIGIGLPGPVEHSTGRPARQPAHHARLGRL